MKSYELRTNADVLADAAWDQLRRDRSRRITLWACTVCKHPTGMIGRCGGAHQKRMCGCSDGDIKPVTYAPLPENA